MAEYSISLNKKDNSITLRSVRPSIILRSSQPNKIVLAHTGRRGENGREIELEQDGTYIKWRYVGDATWTNLIAVTDLEGTDGREVLLQANTEYIQWKYDTDVVWTNLVALDDLKGTDGVNGKSAYEIALDNGFVGTEQEWLDSLRADSVTVNNIMAVGGNIALDTDNIPDTSDNRYVTDTDISKWNAKQDALTADVDYLTPTTASTTYQPKGDYLTAETDPIFMSSEAHNFVTGDKSKLDGIEAGAEVNNISDINATDLTDGGATTLHKHSYNNLDNLPTIPSQYTDEMAQDAVGNILVDSNEIDFTYNDGTPSVTASIKSGSIDETKLDTSINASLDLADSSIQVETDPVFTASDAYGITSTDISNWNSKQNAIGYTPENIANKGQINGYAELDSTGKVPSTQLPSYVDDILEFANYASLPVIGETGKIYVTLDTNKTYRWSGTNYVEISESLALGETSSTAYRGDRGKVAYDHSLLTSGNPHNVTKSDIGLSNVPNTDATNPANITQDSTHRFVTDTEKTYWNSKENALPSAPEYPESKYLNGNKQWAPIAIGGGGFAANLYYTTIPSDVAGYYKISYTPESTETILSGTVTNQELLFRTYLFDDTIDTNIIDAGIWVSAPRIRVSNATGVTKMKLEIFVRHLDTTEITLFSGYSEEINSTSFVTLKVENSQPSYTVQSTDRLGVRVYGSTTSGAAITIYSVIGDGNASYFTTPLRTRHNQLRDLNGDENYQHITSSDVANLHIPVTVTNSSEIDFTLNGQDITANIALGSIDETKLDESVNASLDLADSALQTETDPIFSASDAAGITSTDISNWNAKQESLIADVDYLIPSTASVLYEPVRTTDENYVTDAQLLDIADIQNKIPYTGANSNIDLNGHDISNVTTLSGGQDTGLFINAGTTSVGSPGFALTFKAGDSGGGDTAGGDVEFTPGVKSGAGENGKIKFVNPNGGLYGALDTSLITTESRNYILPDNSGTLALTSDIVPDDTKLNIDQTTPQTTVGSFSFPKVAINSTNPTLQLEVNGQGSLISSSYPVLDVTRISPVNNAIRATHNVTHYIDGDMIDGFGSSMTFSIKDNALTSNIIGSIGAIRNGADNSGSIVLMPYSNGVSQNVMYVTPNQRVGLLTSTPSNTLTLAYSSNGIALYNTADETTNYERAVIYWAGNEFHINTGYGGTGVRRDIYIGDDGDYYQFSRVLNTSYTHNFRSTLSGTSSSGSVRTVVVDTHSAGTAIGNQIYMGLTQSGTAGYYGLLINIAQNTVGSGSKNLIVGTVDGVDAFRVDNTGNIKLQPANGVGYFLFNSVNYGMTMGNSANYQYGGVADYSVKFVMDGGATRGWTWGGYSTAPVMALTTGGNLQLAGTFTLPSTSTGQYFYNTTDQTTNYECVKMYFSGNVFYFDSQNAGTGSSREVRFGLSGGIYRYGSSTSTYLQSYASSGIARMNMFCGTIANAATGFAVSSTLSSSSESNLVVSIQPTITQSGTAAYTALNINVTETSTGSGLKRLIDAKVGSSTKFYVSNTGYTAMPEIEITGDTGIHSSSATALIRVFGGNTAANGAGIVMGGGSHATIGNTGILRVGSLNIMQWTTTSHIYSDGINIAVGSTNGTKIGTATTQKIGFYNATPIIQPSGTSADATDLATAITLVNNLKAKLILLGLIA